MAGTGVRLAGAAERLLAVAEKLGVPVTIHIADPIAFFAPLEPAGLARTIQEALGHRHPSGILRDRALQYSWPRTARIYADIYREIGAL